MGAAASASGKAPVLPTTVKNLPSSYGPATMPTPAPVPQGVGAVAPRLGVNGQNVEAPVGQHSVVPVGQVGPKQRRENGYVAIGGRRKSKKAKSKKATSKKASKGKGKGKAA